MSDSPCTGCRRTDNGRLFYAYVHHYMNVDREDRRVRLCKDCVFEKLSDLLEGADVQEGGVWTPLEASRALLSRESASTQHMGIVQHAENSSGGKRSTSTRTKAGRK